MSTVTTEMTERKTPYNTGLPAVLLRGGKSGALTFVLSINFCTKFEHWYFLFHIAKSRNVILNFLKTKNSYENHYSIHFFNFRYF